MVKPIVEPFNTSRPRVTCGYCRVIIGIYYYCEYELFETQYMPYSSFLFYMLIVSLDFPVVRLFLNGSFVSVKTTWVMSFTTQMGSL